MTLFEARSILNVCTLATQAEIQDAYQRLAHLFHPDRYSVHEDAEAHWQEINAAYEILCRHYDEASRFLKPRDCEQMPKGFAEDSADEIFRGELVHSTCW